MILYPDVLTNASVGYKMRQHISKALVRRSAAIRTSLDRYNKLAIKQKPKRPTIGYSEIASWCLLGEFKLLKDSRYSVLEKPWASPSNRDITTKYFKTVCARTEITRLNVEIARLQDWVDKEDSHLKTVAESLLTTNPLVACAVRQVYLRQRWVNDIHRARLRAISKLPGYSGAILGVSANTNSTDLDDAITHELDATRCILVDEDDVLNDEGNRLDEAMDRISILP